MLHIPHASQCNRQKNLLCPFHCHQCKSSQITFIYLFILNTCFFKGRWLHILLRQRRTCHPFSWHNYFSDYFLTDFFFLLLLDFSLTTLGLFFTISQILLDYFFSTCWLLSDSVISHYYTYFPINNDWNELDESIYYLED